MTIEAQPWKKGRIVAFPVGTNPAKVLTPFCFEDGSVDGRIVIETDRGESLPKTWTTLTDTLTGLEVDVRSASCGLGCFCSAEVKLA